ncbi:MAG: GntR family transcriptional regulator [Anaerolineales bacterium]
MGTQGVSETVQLQLSAIIAEMETGERLPSEPKLANQLGVSRATLREVMRTFETRGLLRRKQGVGTFVIHPTQVFESGLENLVSLETLAERIGLSVSMGELEIERGFPGDEEAEALNLDQDVDIVRVTRVIMAENRPVAYLVDILPTDILAPDEIPPDFTGSILDLLLEKNQPPLASSRTDINATGASPEIASALDIQRHAPLLVFCSQLYSTRGRVVDYSFSYFLPGYFRFHIVRHIGNRISGSS